MKKKINSIKHLLWRISSSTALNWITFLIVSMGIIFDIFNMTFYKIMFVILITELLFVNANADYPIYYYREPTAEELEEAIRQIREANPDIEEEIRRRQNDDK